MSKEQLNRKTQYTRMVVRTAFLQLLTEKPINKITVTEICNLADINRGTFYIHFKDTYDLLEKIEDELYYEMCYSINKMQEEKKHSSEDFLCQLLSIIRKNADICEIIFGKYGDREFLSKCMSINREQNIQILKEEYKDVTPSFLDYIIGFQSSGCCKIIELWIQNGFKESPVELATMMTNLLSTKIKLYF